MNNKLSITNLILFIASLFFGCDGSVKEENKNNAAASAVSLRHVTREKYSIDTTESVITWKGSMLFDIDEEHVGYIHLSKGELMIENGQLMGGTAEIDMNSIEYKDKASKNTPVKHLKSPDYFDVEKFPVSTIAITNIESLRGHTIVKGDLTIKGVTQPVTFPARMEVQDGIVKANGRLIIDRTQWGIRYRSGKFYDNLADQAVSDNIELYMKIVARK
ncbi:YceI family protein [Larkinella punicea]|uniref:YceI family protein n=1 Tax=Larkinella punicea TaxID=2315727 RepID=A0A368JI64_9BACT|nr:YceI family protein [Larkinella punicea]RCR67232.1 YceI family protein [Larkinella punicea]